MKRLGMIIFVQFAATLAAFSPTLQAAEAKPDPDPHQQLDRILERPLYQAWRLRQAGHIPDVDVTIPSRFKQSLRNIGHSIGDFLDWIFSSRSNSSSSKFSVESSLPTILRIVFWLIIGVALIFVGVFLIRILGKTQIAIPVANILSRRQVTQALESGDALALGSAQWMDEARRLAAEQNFRATYRALYLALLSGLHTLGKIEHSRNRTNWAYVQQYLGPTDERVMFADLTQLFDRVWYGRKSAGGSDLEQLRNQVALLTRSGRAA